MDERNCDYTGHNYEQAVHIARAKWVCPNCRDDISFAYTLWWEAVHGDDFNTLTASKSVAI